MINRNKFETTRAAVLAARAKLGAHDSELAVKYGAQYASSWLSSAERSRRGTLERAYDRASARMFKLLEASPRDWTRGIPAHWVAEQLTYDDAVRTLGEPLIHEPPRAYGYR
jgi:hypothetical protein